VHGITTERAMAEGVMREIGIAQIAATIAELAGPAIPLVGHNVSYDLTLLDREMRRLGVGRLGHEQDAGQTTPMVSLWIGGQWLTSFPVIDTYVIDKAVDRYRPGKRRLEAAAQHYGVPMAEGSAHGATADVFASLRIAYRIHQRALAAADYMDRYQESDRPLSFQSHPFMRHYAGRRNPLDLVHSFATLSTLTLADLHEHQVRWAAEQADGLREYFIKSGTGDPDSVSADWPVRRLAEEEMFETVDTTV
jgi:DNA polymerase-3 subunit epsilon